MSIRDSGETARLDAVSINNRELANFLRDQLQVLLDLREKVLAIEQLIERTPSLKGEFEACLASVKADPSRQPRSAWLATAERLFGALSRQ
jgi:hypothetical protein